MYIEVSKNILLICLTIGFIYLFINSKKYIENFNETQIKESIKNLAEISKSILNNDNTLTIPANKVKFRGNASFPKGKNVTIDGKLNVNELNILPRGCIIAWKGDDIPDGWLLCDGNNGTPNLRGRFILGQSEGRNVNETGGEENHTLSENEIPKHKHKLCFYNDDYNEKGGTEPQKYRTGVQARGLTNDCQNNCTQTCLDTNPYGNGDAHNNMPPFYVLTYIMKS